MLKIFLADDHDVVRQGLRVLIQNQYPGVKFGEGKTADEVLAAVSGEAWDAVVLDLSMPGKSGLATLREIKRMQPQTPVLVLSMYPESQFATRVLKEGAAGYIEKSCAGSELLKALRAACAGRRYISEELAESIACNLAEPEKSPHQLLSNREYEVLLAIASGKSISDIAAELDISIKTVSTYKRRVVEKLNLKSTAELIRYALEHKLL